MTGQLGGAKTSAGRTGVLWNPRYVAYAAAHRSTPEDRLKKDADEFPGGCMTGFTLWIGKKRAEWSRLPDHGALFPGSRSATQAAHDDFTAWLKEGGFE